MRNGDPGIKEKVPGWSGLSGGKYKYTAATSSSLSLPSAQCKIGENPPVLLRWALFLSQNGIVDFFKFSSGDDEKYKRRALD